MQLFKCEILNRYFQHVHRVNLFLALQGNRHVEIVIDNRYHVLGELHVELNHVGTMMRRCL